MTEKTARAISLTNRITSSDTECELSTKGLTERVLRLYPVHSIESTKAKLAQKEAGVVDEVDDARIDPMLTAEHLVIVMDSAERRTRVVSVLAEVLRQVSPSDLRYFAVAAEMLSTYASQNELSDFFRESSILAAMVSLNISLEIGSVSKDRAVLSGLLSEVGALACLKVDTTRFQSIWNQSGGLPVRRAKLEIAQYGGTTHTLGSGLLVDNGFPAEVAEAVATRVNEETRNRGSLARIAAFSRTVAAELIRCSQQKHEQNLIGTLPKFGKYFDLDVDKNLLANPSIIPLLRRDIS